MTTSDSGDTAGVLTDDLIRLYPRLFHVAEAGSWSDISHHGLLTSAQLCELYEVPDHRRRGLLEARRAGKAPLDHPIHGRVVLRDQSPLSEKKLAACLQDGITVEQWLTTLNDRVFFWLQENRLLRMLNAYSGQDHDVITVDTASLVAAHGPQVRLSRINSGSTAYLPRPRGTATFQTIEEYPHPQRRKAVAAASDVAELCVLGGVADLAAHAVKVERRHGPAVVETIWQRP